MADPYDTTTDSTPAPGAPPEGSPSWAATAPHRIPAQHWKLILPRVARHLIASRIPLLSAGIAFFAVLSIAPVLVTALSVYGAVNTPADAAQQLSNVARVLPPEIEPIVADQLTTITAASANVLTVRGLTGLVIALWTATTAMTSLIDTLTVAYHETETRSIARRTGLAVAFVLGGAVLLGAVIGAARLASSVLGDMPAQVHWVIPVLAWLTLAILVSAVLAVLYRLAPDRKDARWAWTSWGAAGATLVWLAASMGLFFYVQHLGTYKSTYGSLAGWRSACSGCG